MKDDTISAALKHFETDYNCAQSVLKALLDAKVLPVGLATEMAAGFGGGISHSGQQCGAISGALMAIGAIVGQSTSDIDEQKSETYRLSEELISGFEGEFGTIICDELTGIDMKNGEEVARAIESGFFSRNCSKYLKWATNAVLVLTST